MSGAYLGRGQVQADLMVEAEVRRVINVDVDRRRGDSLREQLAGRSTRWTPVTGPVSTRRACSPPSQRYSRPAGRSRLATAARCARPPVAAGPRYHATLKPARGPARPGSGSSVRPGPVPAPGRSRDTRCRALPHGCARPRAAAPDDSTAGRTPRSSARRERGATMRGIDVNPDAWKCRVGPGWALTFPDRAPSAQAPGPDLRLATGRGLTPVPVAA
jgi:hypothetical protein